MHPQALPGRREGYTDLSQALLIPPDISQVLFLSLRALDSPTEEDVLSVVCDFVEPLATLKATVLLGRQSLSLKAQMLNRR